MPFIGRLKDALSVAVNDYCAKHPTEAAGASSSFDNIYITSLHTKKGRQAQVPPHPSTHIFLNLPNDESSDDEASSLSSSSQHMYSSTVRPAAPPPNLWPPKLGFDRLSLLRSTLSSSGSNFNGRTSSVNNTNNIHASQATAGVGGGPLRIPHVVPSPATLASRGETQLLVSPIIPLQATSLAPTASADGIKNEVHTKEGQGESRGDMVVAEDA